MSNGNDRFGASTCKACFYHGTRAVLTFVSTPARVPAGSASIGFRRSGAKTVVAEAVAASPLRLLTPRNHGSGAWVYLSNLGGGLVDGDRIDIRVDAAAGTSALLGTQASTKVYRSPHGCSQRLTVQAAESAAVAIAPDPVACFAGARYSQEITVSLASGASLFLLDGYTCGRAAFGERWQFESLRSRTTITRGGLRSVVDATLLDAAHGNIAERMGRFDAVLSLVAMGPRFAPVCAAMCAPSTIKASGKVVVAVSPLGLDGALLRVAGDCFESASRPLRSSFAALANVLGDNPFARKW
jgi:urease accessory protein